MAIEANKGHAALRRGRYSLSGADYFLTICTASKQTGLTAPVIATAILREATVMSDDGTWILHCAVVMPDHVHLLISLGERLPLGKTVQRLKARTAAPLRSVGLEWERGFYDRHLRPDDERLSVFQYVYLNPYRAGLLPAEKKWPHYYCRDEEWTWFRELLDHETPIPEWLR